MLFSSPYSAPDKYFSNQYHTGQILIQSVTTKTGILESVPMLRIFLHVVLFLGPGAGEERVRSRLVNLLLSMFFDALIFVCLFL